MNITYVTGNYGKYLGVKKIFSQNELSLSFFECDLDEPNINDIDVISKAKVISAYKLLNKPCFVIDSGFYIEDYPLKPNYPGAFVKRSGISNNIDELLKTMENVDNRKCKFVDCLTFYDGENFYTFHGLSEGSLSYTKRGRTTNSALSNLWYVFIPNNCTKTLAEMSEEERVNRCDNHTSATLEFVNWYKNVYLKKDKVLCKSIIDKCSLK